jgi:hypothetical protein
MSRYIHHRSTLIILCIVAVSCLSFNSHAGESVSSQKFDGHKYNNDADYRLSINTAIIDLPEGKLQAADKNLIMSVLGSGEVDRKYKGAAICAAGEHKLCETSKVLVEMLEVTGGSTTAVYDLTKYNCQAQEALIQLGNCAEPAMTSYLKSGKSLRVKQQLTSIMYHHLGSKVKVIEKLQKLKVKASVELREQLDTLIHQVNSWQEE